MSVTIADVRTVANLAYLRFSPEEEERLAGDLSRILEYMEKLSELDTEGVQPTSHVIPLTNAWRADEVEISADQTSLMVLAPERRDGQFKVPRVID